MVRSEDEIQVLLGDVADARAGLSQDVFLLISSLTPMVNVDLLIRDDASRTLLTWREDRFYGPGWHIPGGIIRFKETWSHRIGEVARIELGACVEAEPFPMLISEIMSHERDVRGHFLSLLFRCRLSSEPDSSRQFSKDNHFHGAWAWFEAAPENMITQHEFYRNIIDDR